MKKLIMALVFTCITAICVNYSCGQEDEGFELRQGTRRKVVNEQYGAPIMTEKLKWGFLPIPREKALYKVDDLTYLILHFFSGRVSNIIILDDVDYEKAISLFKEE